MINIYQGCLFVYRNGISMKYGILLFLLSKYEFPKCKRDGSFYFKT